MPWRSCRSSMPLTCGRNQGQAVYVSECSRYELCLFTLVYCKFCSYSVFSCIWIQLKVSEGSHLSFVPAILEEPVVPPLGLMEPSYVKLITKEVSHTQSCYVPSWLSNVNCGGSLMLVFSTWSS